MPQSARLSAGGGGELLFGKCPNRGGDKLKGASLKYSFWQFQFQKLKKATWFIRGGSCKYVWTAGWDNKINNEDQSKCQYQIHFLQHYFNTGEIVESGERYQEGHEGEDEPPVGSFFHDFKSDPQMG